MKTAEQYADEALNRAVPLPADRLALRRADGELLRRVATDAVSAALADAWALPGAMAPPDVVGMRAHLERGRRALHPHTEDGAWWDRYARDVPTLLAWSDYLAGWVHDLLLDRGAYDARREGEAAGLRRAAAEVRRVADNAPEPGQPFVPVAGGRYLAERLHALADSLGAGPPPPPARPAADLAACRAALAGLLRVLETEEGDDLAALDRALDVARTTLGGQPT